MGIFYRVAADLFGKILVCQPGSHVVSSYFSQNSEQCFAVALILQASKRCPFQGQSSKRNKEKEISVGKQTTHKRVGIPVATLPVVRRLTRNLPSSNTMVLQSQENSNLMLVLCCYKIPLWSSPVFSSPALNSFLVDVL
jgi:hypothetical protein